LVENIQIEIESLYFGLTSKKTLPTNESKATPLFPFPDRLAIIFARNLLLRLMCMEE